VIGVFEEMVLLALVRCGGETYGVPVRDEIQQLVGRDIAMGAVYATLDRLREKGLVSTRSGNPDPVRGGRPRRYFRVESLGIEALRHASEVRSAMWDGVSLPPSLDGA
jgi:DNA-binding PadR family transcriptional regulator